MLSTKLKYKINQALSPLVGKGIIVAFSGGVDSTVVARIVQKASNNIRLITITSNWISNQEIEEAQKIALQLDLPHEIFEVEVKEDHIFWENPPDRCYHCKKVIFSQLHDLAMREGYEIVIDGTNDVITPSANYLILAEKIPGAWLVQINGAGHGLMYQYPQKFSTIVKTFLEEG